jgi:hypothetical protein
VNLSPTPSPSPLQPQTPLDALQAVIGSLDALRNGRALYVLLGTFTVTGLLLGMAQGAFARGAPNWGVVQAGFAFFAAFYGATAAGLLLMDQAMGRERREVVDAVADALTVGHRLLLVLLAASIVPLLSVLATAALVVLARTDVSGALGPWVFAVTVPLAVVAIGVSGLALTAVVVPLAGPAIWAGLGVRQTLGWLATQVRRRLLLAAVLMAAVAGLTSVVGALVAAVVMTGARVVALLGVFVGGIDLPPQQLMAGLFGHGMRGAGATAATPHGSAALVGGGVVFAVALVTPVLITLRGACAAFLVLQRTEQGPPQP